MPFRQRWRVMLNGWFLGKWKGLVEMDLGEKEIERVKYPLRRPERAIPVPNWPVREPVKAPETTPAIPVEVPQGAPAS